MFKINCDEDTTCVANIKPALFPTEKPAIIVQNSSTNRKSSSKFILFKVCLIVSPLIARMRLLLLQIRQTIAY